MRSLLLTSSPNWPWARQLPTQLPPGCAIDIDRPVNGAIYDLIFVFEDIAVDRLSVHCRECHFIPGEPREITAIYHPRFVSQFDALHGFRRDIRHPRNIASHSWLPWFYGVDHDSAYAPRLDCSALRAQSSPPKDRLLSVVCSNKTHTPDHRRRLAFIRLLKEKLGDRLEVFGSGLRRVGDKAEAIDRYRYHLVMENSVHPGYVSEKLWDSFLGWSCPIYYGAPDAPLILDWPELPTIDIEQPEVAAAAVLQLINSDADRVSHAAIARVRQDILTRHNVMTLLAESAAQIEPTRPIRALTLRSHAYFQSRWPTRLRRVCGRLASWVKAPRREAQ